MKHIQTHIAILVFLICGLNLHAQNFREDYRKVYKNYMDHPRMSVDIDYKMYSDANSTVPVQVQTGTCRMDGKKLYTDYFGSENMESNPYHVYVDNSRKYILITEKNSTEKGIQKKLDKENKKENPLQLVDSSMKNLSKVEFKGDHNGIMQYHLVPITGKEIMLYIDTKTWLLQKIVMFSATPITSKGKTLPSPRMEIIYRNITLKPVYGSNEFSLSRFGTMVKGKFVLNTKYKSYKLDYKKTNA